MPALNIALRMVAGYDTRPLGRSRAAMNGIGWAILGQTGSQRSQAILVAGIAKATELLARCPIWLGSSNGPS